jgi:GNAT superfamily N-acetyltransferase
MTTIRRAELSDAERLGQLHSQCWAELYTGVLPDTVLEELSAGVMGHLWQRFVQRGEGYDQYVAEHDGIVVGFVGYGPGRDEGFTDQREIYFIYVHPDFQRAGIGSQLLQADPDASYLWISERNRSAHKFYRRNGLGPDSRRRIGTLFGTDLPEIRLSR